MMPDKSNFFFKISDLSRFPNTGPFFTFFNPQNFTFMNQINCTDVVIFDFSKIFNACYDLVLNMLKIKFYVDLRIF